MLAFKRASLRKAISTNNSCDSADRKASSTGLSLDALRAAKRWYHQALRGFTAALPRTQDVAGVCGLTLQNRKLLYSKDVCGGGGDEILESCSATECPLERRPELTPKLHSNHSPGHLGMALACSPVEENHRNMFVVAGVPPSPPTLRVPATSRLRLSLLVACRYHCASPLSEYGVGSSSAGMQDRKTESMLR